MKKGFILGFFLLLSSLIFSESQGGLLIKPIEGISKDFIRGADVSMLPEIESLGGKYLDQNGIEKDCLLILRENGVNWIRVRLWNHPVYSEDVIENGKIISKASDPVGGGNNDLAKYINLAKRAKKLGLKVLLDFHYSDFWADPSKQTKPAAWKDLTQDELEKEIYTYTYETLKTLSNESILPDMVQIGNEVNGGFLWPEGKTWQANSSEKVGGQDGFAALLKQAALAVRTIDPKKKIKIVIHIAQGADNALFQRVLEPLTERQVDYDIIGISFYPYWHGKIADLAANMNDLAKRYNKEIIIAETAYGWTFDNADKTGNLFGPGCDKLGWYTATIQGQATAIRDIMAAVSEVPKAKGLGVFYWEPDWIPTPGAGWRTGEGNAWENQAMFDFKGKALPSLSVFKDIYDTQQISEPKVISADNSSVITLVKHEAVLPATLKTVYSDGSIRVSSVNWESIPKDSLAKPQNILVKGKLIPSQFPVTVSVTVATSINLIEDPSFETGKLSDGWEITGDVKAAMVEKNPGNAHSGEWSFKYWLDKPFHYYLTKTYSGLTNGTYTLKVWSAGGGGEKSFMIFAKDFGDGALTAPIVDTGWQKWKLYTIRNIKVSNGKCTIGIDCDGDSGNWGNVDDFDFSQESE